MSTSTHTRSHPVCSWLCAYLCTYLQRAHSARCILTVYYSNPYALLKEETRPKQQEEAQKHNKSVATHRPLPRLPNCTLSRRKVSVKLLPSPALVSRGESISLHFLPVSFLPLSSPFPLECALFDSYRQPGFHCPPHSAALEKHLKDSMRQSDNGGKERERERDGNGRSAGEGEGEGDMCTGRK